ncbi:MAG: nicotinamide riboside transporter PnuC [Pseudomonadota bacterium]
MSEPLEIAANAVGTLSIFLAGRNSIHTWWTGILGCSLFALLFYGAALYADMVLQVFFIGASALGWWQWRRGAHGQGLPVSSGRLAQLAWTIPVGLAATAGYGAMLHHYTNAYAPFADSAVLVFSVIAQLLLMQRRVESWPFWLLVNSIAIPLYLSRELQLTALLYAGYWCNALVSWLLWRRLLRHQSAAPAHP